MIGEMTHAGTTRQRRESAGRLRITGDGDLLGTKGGDPFVTALDLDTAAALLLGVYLERQSDDEVGVLVDLTAAARVAMLEKVG